MNPLDLIRLTQLMEIARGKSEVIVGLVDGPVVVDHPDLTHSNIREIPGKQSGICTMANSVACTHGTLVAGVLAARRGSAAPAICPGCTLFVRPIFAESTAFNEQMPSATPTDLAEAIIEMVDTGAKVINVSAALVPVSGKAEYQLQEALDHAARREVIVVVAAGNQGSIGSTFITRHPWVIPVTACDLQGRPLAFSNIGHSIGIRGLSAPGENISSLGANGKPRAFGGTSAAAPFVTGTIALLLSIFNRATSAEVNYAMTQGSTARRKTIVPPLLDAWSTYQFMAQMQGRR